MTGIGRHTTTYVFLPTHTHISIHSGPTLLEAMDELAPATKLLAEARAKPLRLFVTDVVQVRFTILALSCACLAAWFL